MALQSQLFRGDAKLEAAAISDPAHITRGASGPHVVKIQQALIQVDGAAISPDGAYGQGTAAAVSAFKTKRRILNFAGMIDDIVGKKTIAALDSEMAAKERGGRVLETLDRGAGGAGANRAIVGNLLGNVLGAGLRQDIFVLLQGTGNRNEEGTRIKAQEDDFTRKAEFNTTTYLATHQPIAAVIFFGGRGLKDPSAAVAALVAALRLASPSGVTIISGNSVGALSALKTAALVSALNLTVDYLNINDGAFFDRDGEIISVNPLQIALPGGIKALKADNFFQTFGHELLRRQGPFGPSGFAPGVEFHGPLRSPFVDNDLQFTGTKTRSKMVEISGKLSSFFRIDTVSSRIAFSNEVHVAAVDDGEEKRDAVMKTLIKP
jgi:peptidoglycan hydrolase-like protein with peptidoglycan-binding domain